MEYFRQGNSQFVDGDYKDDVENCISAIKEMPITTTDYLNSETERSRSLISEFEGGLEEFPDHDSSTDSVKFVRHYDHFCDALVKGRVAVVQAAHLSFEEKFAFIDRHQRLAQGWYAQHGPEANSLQLVRQHLQYQAALEELLPSSRVLVAPFGPPGHETTTDEIEATVAPRAHAALRHDLIATQVAVLQCNASLVARSDFITGIHHSILSWFASYGATATAAELLQKQLELLSASDLDEVVMAAIERCGMTVSKTDENEQGTPRSPVTSHTG